MDVKLPLRMYPIIDPPLGQLSVTLLDLCSLALTVHTRGKYTRRSSVLYITILTTILFLTPIRYYSLNTLWFTRLANNDIDH